MNLVADKVIIIDYYRLLYMMQIIVLFYMTICSSWKNVHLVCLCNKYIL